MIAKCATPGCPLMKTGMSIFCEDHLQQGTPGIKYDKDKPLFDLLPPYAIAAIADVLTYGAKKYAPENWRKVKGWRWRYLGAALRHVFAYMQGHKIDPESGCLHLAHAACCLCFMLELDAVGDTHGDERA